MVHFNYRLKETLEDIHSSHIWRTMQSIKILSTQLSPLYKVVPVHAMKTYGGSRGIAPLILNLDTRREWFSSRPGHFTNTRTQRIRGRMDIRADLDVLERR